MAAEFKTIAAFWPSKSGKTMSGRVDEKAKELASTINGDSKFILNKSDAEWLAENPKRPHFTLKLIVDTDEEW